MCNTVLPPAQTTGIPQPNGDTVGLTTSPSTTLPAAVGGSCSLICLFPTPEDDQAQIQVSSVAVINPETNEPYGCFGPFRQSEASRRAARRVLRSLTLPVRRRRLDICAFRSRVTGPIPDGAPAVIQWEVSLEGAKPEQFRELLGEFHGWISGELNGRRFRNHVCFTQVEKIVWEG